jgi:hypothetical protein
MAILHEFDRVEPLRSRLSNTTPTGVSTLWPELEDVVVARTSDRPRWTDEDDR